MRPLQDLVSETELNWLIDEVKGRGGKVSTRSTPDCGDVPYELNITYASALSDPESTEIGMARFLCSQAVALSLQGMPAVYFNSLFGAANNPAVTDEHKRAINRERWNVNELNEKLTDPSTIESEVFEKYLSMVRGRANRPAFHPNGPQKVLDFGDKVFAVLRWSPDRSDRVLCVFNFSRAEQSIAIEKMQTYLDVNVEEESFLKDVLLGLQVTPQQGGIVLSPYQAMWLIE